MTTILPEGVRRVRNSFVCPHDLLRSIPGAISTSSRIGERSCCAYVFFLFGFVRVLHQKGFSLSLFLEGVSL